MTLPTRRTRPVCNRNGPRYYTDGHPELIRPSPKLPVREIYNARCWTADVRMKPQHVRTECHEISQSGRGSKPKREQLTAGPAKNELKTPPKKQVTIRDGEQSTRTDRTRRGGLGTNLGSATGTPPARRRRHLRMGRGEIRSLLR